MNAAQKLSIAAGLLIALLISCGDDEESDEPVAPPGPAALTIEAFIGASGERFSREQAGEVVLACPGLLAVELATPNWLLRPPANCGATPQCGHVAVMVDDVLVEASTSTVVVPLGESAAGSHHVRAELRLSDRTAFIGDAGTPVADELEITVSVLPCPDAAGGAGGAGGAPTTGAGGADGGAAGSGGAPAAGAGGAADQGGQGGSTSPGGAGGAGGASPTGGAGGA